MKHIEQCLLKLRFDRKLPSEIHGNHLRGFIANTAYADSIFHQHNENGESLYTYSVIQYKIVNGDALVLGLQKGTEPVMKLDLLGKRLSLHNQYFLVVDQERSLRRVSFGVSDGLIPYEFITPWLALNENNYNQFVRTGSKQKSMDLLRKILIGNILSLSKGVEYTVSEQVRIDELQYRDVFVTLNDAVMKGFFGSFETNFMIPDFWGLGKSVSRGFGAVVRK